MKKKGFIGFVLCIFLYLIAGCVNSPSTMSKIIEKDLEERYGGDFEMRSIKKIGGSYEAVFFPTDDPSMNFDCMYGDDGSFGYDYYVGTIISHKDSEFLMERITTGLGEVFVFGSPFLLIDNGSPQYESNIEICDLIKNGTFSIEEAYEISPVKNLLFFIFINTSDNAYVDDAGTEFDVISEAVNALIEKYKTDYNIDVDVRLWIYILDNDSFEKTKDYFLVNSNMRETYEYEIECASNHIVFHKYTSDDNTSSNYELTRDEYIEIRKEMNK